MSNRNSVKTLQWELNKERNMGKGKGRDKVAPSVPVSLVANATSHATVELSWGASTDDRAVEGYQIYRDDARIAWVTVGTTFADSGLAALTAYEYEVAAYDKAGNTSARSNTATATTSAAPEPPPIPGPPDAPSDLTATAVNDSAIKLLWTPPNETSGILGYRVLRGGSLVARVAQITYTDTGLTANTSYSYTVEAYDGNGNTSLPSNTATATTQQVAPVPPPPAGTAPVLAIVGALSASPPTWFTENLTKGQARLDYFWNQYLAGTIHVTSMAYYDFATTLYYWAERTGNPVYATRGDTLVSAWLDWCGAATGSGGATSIGFKAQPHILIVNSLEIYYIRTGDIRAKWSILSNAKLYAGVSYLGSVGYTVGGRSAENRMVARYFQCIMAAATTGGQPSYLPVLETMLDMIAAHQSADGGHRYALLAADEGFCFMDGLLCEQLMQYQRRIKPDARADSIITKTVAWLKTLWIPSINCWPYAYTRTTTPSYLAELNALITPAFLYAGETSIATSAMNTLHPLIPTRTASKAYTEVVCAWRSVPEL